MGREIRRVPPNWEHPRRNCPHSPWAGGCDEAKSHGGKCYQPLYDRDFETAAQNWLDEWAEWTAGEFGRVMAKHPDLDYKADEPFRAFCTWHGEFPDPEYFRPKWDESAATWFQVYQTVSEGSPVTPPFATREELVDYLVAHGDFWDQSRRKEGRYSDIRCDPWERAAAEKFVNGGWAPSMLITTGAAGTTIQEPRDGI